MPFPCIYFSLIRSFLPGRLPPLHRLILLILLQLRVHLLLLFIPRSITIGPRRFQIFGKPWPQFVQHQID